MDSNPTPSLSPLQKRLLTTIFERAADSASQALTTWLGQTVHMSVSEIDDVELVDASELLGPSETLVAACGMNLEGRLNGEILLVFEDSAGLALADLLLRNPVGTSTEWGELEQSAACETANIVGCALLNSLAAHLPALPGPATGEGNDSLVPSPPTFRHEFAGSLLQFALMDQAVVSERVLVARSQFTSDGQALRWSLLFVPGAATLGALAAALSNPQHA